RELGFGAAAVNLSDLAASGADPDALLVTLACPGSAAVEDVLELYEGIAEAGVTVVGGDTTAAGSVVVTVTALGRSVRVPGRSGARAGDLLVVTGRLGAAGGGGRGGGGRPPASAPRRGQAARSHGPRHARRLRRDRGGRGAPGAAFRRAVRDRPRRGPARRRGGAGRPRLRRGLRAARRRR